MPKHYLKRLFEEAGIDDVPLEPRKLGGDLSACNVFSYDLAGCLARNQHQKALVDVRAIDRMIGVMRRGAPLLPPYAIALQKGTPPFMLRSPQFARFVHPLEPQNNDATRLSSEAVTGLPASWIKDNLAAAQGVLTPDAISRIIKLNPLITSILGECAESSKLDLPPDFVDYWCHSFQRCLIGAMNTAQHLPSPGSQFTEDANSGQAQYIDATLSETTHRNTSVFAAIMRDTAAETLVQRVFYANMLEHPLARMKAETARSYSNPYLVVHLLYHARDVLMDYVQAFKTLHTTLDDNFLLHVQIFTNTLAYFAQNMAFTRSFVEDNAHHDATAKSAIFCGMWNLLPLWVHAHMRPSHYDRLIKTAVSYREVPNRPGLTKTIVSIPSR